MYVSKECLGNVLGITGSGEMNSKGRKKISVWGTGNRIKDVELDRVEGVVKGVADGLGSKPEEKEAQILEIFFETLEAIQQRGVKGHNNFP